MENQPVANFVTHFVTQKLGRKRVYASNAQRQRAYRRRKAEKQKTPASLAAENPSSPVGTGKLNTPVSVFEYEGPWESVFGDG
jgi:hypothetical protein